MLPAKIATSIHLYNTYVNLPNTYPELKASFTWNKRLPCNGSNTNRVVTIPGLRGSHLSGMVSEGGTWSSGGTHPSKAGTSLPGEATASSVHAGWSSFPFLKQVNWATNLTNFTMALFWVDTPVMERTYNFIQEHAWTKIWWFVNLTHGLLSSSSV